LRVSLGLCFVGCSGLALGACHPAESGLAPGASDPRNDVVSQAAAAQFERDDHCPVDNLEARRVVYVPPAPPEVASDPDRLALWENRWGQRAKTDPRLLVEVTGCGIHALYSCWEVAALPTFRSDPRRMGRGPKRVVVGATCLSENGYISAESGP
jgi:hypothetical protein